MQKDPSRLALQGVVALLAAVVLIILSYIAVTHSGENTPVGNWFAVTSILCGMAGGMCALVGLATIASAMEI